MAIGKRIRFFRNRKGMTQKQTGEILGFLGKTSDVRMAQYESEARVPKHDLVREMANLFDVSTQALTVPDIDTYVGLMHTFFALEDMYGLKIGEIDGEPCLCLDKSDYSTYTSMYKMLHSKSMHGSWKPPSWKGAKLPEKNMMHGATNIPTSTPTKSGLKFLPKNFLTFSLVMPTKQIRLKRKAQNGARKNNKKPCQFSVAISENQQGYSLILM